LQNCKQIANLKAEFAIYCQDYPNTIIKVLSMTITGVAYFEDWMRPMTTLYNTGVGSDKTKKTTVGA
jgi:hypothetical protein